MFKENQQPTDSDHGIETNKSSYTAPYRHRGYKKALYALRDALENHSAVILKGVEGTGKTTLISELMSDYQHKGVPVIRFSSRLTKVSQFYAQLADCLEVPKHKKDLIQALRNTKNAGQYCLVVIDQEAIESSADIAETLKQLCLTSETTSRSIKLVVIRKDYLVIHTEGTPEADFHNWIKTEVTLDPLQTDDIEGFIYYLSAIKGLQPTPYEIGTDFVMIEQTEGRISRLKALLLPLIHNDVITQRDFKKSDKSNKPIHSNHSGIIALAFVVLLATGVGINHFIFSDTSTEPSQIAATKTVPNKEPVFAEPSNKDNPDNYKVTPPSVSKTNTSESPELPVLAAEVKNTQPSTAAPIETNIKVQKAVTPEIVETAKASTENTSQQFDNELASLSEEEFQAEMKIRLLLLEQELTEAVVENNRLKIALLETKAETTKQAIKQPNTLTLSEKASQAELRTTENSTTEEATPVPYLEEINKSEIASNNASQTLTETKSILENAVSTSSTVDIDIAEVDADISEVDADISEKTDSSEKLATQTIVQPINDIEQVTTVIDRWQNAWETQNHESYSDNYTSNFNGAYKTHQRWLKKRYDALTSPTWIKLTRSELTNFQPSDSNIKVDFWINYEADSGYKDKTLKRLTLTKVDGQWLISKEQNIQVKPFF